jgi:hypothetical protein
MLETGWYDILDKDEGYRIMTMPQLNVFGKVESCNKAEFLTTDMVF